MSTSTSTRTRRLPAWSTSFGTQIIAALVVGLILGLVAKYTGGTPAKPNALGATLSTIGSSYVALLQTAVVPLIFTAVVSSIANLRQVSNAAKLAWNTLLWFAITAFISVLIGIGLGVLFQPGANTGITQQAKYTGKTGDWWAFLTGLFPHNFLGLTASSTVADGGAVSTSVSFNVLQILVIAIAVGIAVLKIGAKADPFLTFTRSALEIIQKVLWWIIRIAPLGSIGLIGNAVAAYGWDTIGALGKFVLAIYVGLALVLFVVYPIIVKSHGPSIKQYFSGVWPAVELGFVSRSSIGTLPLTQRLAERNLGVPQGYASFAVPLGATTKMDGCAAVYPAVASIFVAQFFGLHLDFSQYLLIVIVSVLGSAATAGTTGAVVMLTLTLSTLGLPLAGVGLLLSIDPVLDMGRTGVNVAGQALVPTIVAKRQGILDLALYNAKRSRAAAFDDDADGHAAGNAASDGELVAAR